LKLYSDNELLPKITDEINLTDSLMDPKKSMWYTLYKNNPDNYWCKIFIDRMSSAKKDEIDKMVYYGVRLEEVLSKIVSKLDPITPEDDHEIVISIVRHLEFFHKMNEHFFYAVVEFCERAKDSSKERPWVDSIILSNPKILSQNPLLGMLSTRYTSAISNALLSNKEKVLGGEFSIPTNGAL
jgi:hypothetical protein